MIVLPDQVLSRGRSRCTLSFLWFNPYRRTTHEHDVVIEDGEVRKRKKKPSKKFRNDIGHTPLSVEEDTPWKCRRLAIGTGAYGKPRVITKVKRVVGTHNDIEKAAKILGYADRPGATSDIAFMSAAVVIGSLVGALTIPIAGVPLSLSTSVGTLIAGLVCGYLRSVYRTFRHISEPALWVFNNVGLNGFIAVVGPQCCCRPRFRAEGLLAWALPIRHRSLPSSVNRRTLRGKIHLQVSPGDFAGCLCRNSLNNRLRSEPYKKLQTVPYPLWDTPFPMVSAGLSLLSPTSSSSF